MENEAISLDYEQDIEKHRPKKIYRAIFIQMDIQLMISRMSLRRTLEDDLRFSNFLGFVYLDIWDNTCGKF
jgi:hypothetical protein